MPCIDNLLAKDFDPEKNLRSSVYLMWSSLNLNFYAIPKSKINTLCLSFPKPIATF